MFGYNYYYKLLILRSLKATNMTTAYKLYVTILLFLFAGYYIQSNNYEPAIRPPEPDQQRGLQLVLVNSVIAAPQYIRASELAIIDLITVTRYSTLPSTLREVLVLQLEGLAELSKCTSRNLRKFSSSINYTIGNIQALDTYMLRCKPKDLLDVFVYGSKQINRSTKTLIDEAEVNIDILNELENGLTEIYGILNTERKLTLENRNTIVIPSIARL